MAKPPVVYTPAANEDLIGIWCHIAQDSPKAADRFVDDLIEPIEQLAHFPESAPLRLDIARDVRVLAFGSYLILRRIRGQMVEVVRIVHRARDASTLV